MAGRRVDMSKYQMVKDRLPKFWADYPDGRIDTNLVPTHEGQWIVKAELYRNWNDPFPAASGIAQEVVGAGPVNETNALENCETSAIGRALANWVYASGAERPSREEMEKVQRGPVEPPKQAEATEARVGAEMTALGAALRNAKVSATERARIGAVLRDAFGPPSDISADQYEDVWGELWVQLGYEVHAFDGKHPSGECKVCKAVMIAPWHSQNNEEPFPVGGGDGDIAMSVDEEILMPHDGEKQVGSAPKRDAAAIKMHDALQTWSEKEVLDEIKARKIPAKGTLDQKRLTLGNALMAARVEPVFKGAKADA